jgi:dihydropteroate synthase
MNTFDPRFNPETGSKPVSTSPKDAQGIDAAVPVRGVRPREIRCGSMTLALGRRPLVMGILNVTPDSFSDGGRFIDPGAAVSHALEMCDAGADIVDIGGESTRPGSDPVSAGVELDRVLPVIDALTNARGSSKATGVPISIDTRRAEVADAALRRGCHMINDVSAASDSEMADVLRDHPDVPIVLMHMKGDPKAMQEAPYYDDVVAEVRTFLDERARMLTGAGIARDRIVVDPGIGFGKRFGDNLELLNRVDSLRALGYPVLIGASRKRFLGELLDADPERRLPGSLAVAARCMQNGVDIVRVHDVTETTGLFRVLDAMEHPGDYEADW